MSGPNFSSGLNSSPPNENFFFNWLSELAQVIEMLEGNEPDSLAVTLTLIRVGTPTGAS